MTVIGLLLSVVTIWVQNQSPTLSLVFLGMRSEPLPLGFWIAGAVLIGALGSLGIFAILSMAPLSPLHARRRAKFQQQPSNHPQPDRVNRGNRRRYSDWDEPVATDWYGSSKSEPFFDDNSDYFENEQDFADDPFDYPDEDYDDSAPPWEKRDSSYSFSYRDPKFARQRSQRESVFDAEYRVITPPQKPDVSSDDWDEFDDQFRED
ncbi:hypothetical protein [Acaryochloris sp. IP29b_bin.137]|uniref:hypothetical protein n=1 Tax=Acaryochloris sp. IP29b_bin.137 TaxID=2969217 RepID=UPI0026301CE2|nr:hypothetical protein [Acaryochloris sp. IP29b_bin.137]